MTGSEARAPFITFEGIDGAGKTTQLESLCHFLQSRGTPFERTREPGGTPAGERLREVVLAEAMQPETELLVMFAARCEHVQARILPAITAGRWVVCDRFSDASYAYQVGGRGVDAARFALIERWVLGGFRPDLTFLFDLDPAVAGRRLAQAGARGRDRFERLDQAFFARVRAAYLERAAREPGRFVVLDATRPPEALSQQVIAEVQRRWPS
ncbi:dTMP kinase [Tepidiphilus sp. HLB4]|jgi:dTMP kinase